ncbi:MAG: excinuclease ABC subunit B [Candidatus Yanofskybacteria bacterium RIFCSPHIGHO2_02_FULL_43_15c]|uniref:UvrABC system protein B n=1 Tax=Candidatus Yanofskybacteria bacterium RIFCSPHIGHO2_02_FULL_43_15c TaxID=1802679 RepID=A0A1F8FMN2_9BACT|nr:MAG: excinuclease ABC subunit B [Candidatus Yanofskybacteria bacterium RIFCSPHIGHO2_02_FULL_43_15c]OGY66452.1 MAG: excinuclease ABC subunit B [Candidatus Harrisonbacteria bacterium RIFCSPLOWO2_02_FULL_41_11]
MFKLTSKFKPTGDQPQAIAKLTQGLKNGLKHQTLLGVTGSGKTFSIANVIANVKKPTLIISPNKTLAAQLYQEFKEFFPKNSVHYFVSYYDYYQPEAYIPHTHTYIEKDARINEEIDRLRHAATQALLTRDDVIIVASVSCIYNLGSPEEYEKLSLDIFEGQKMSAAEFNRHLLQLQYVPDVELKRGKFRKTREEFEIIPATGNEVLKIKILNNKIHKISEAENINLDNLEFDELKFERLLSTKIFPAKYWIAPQNKLALALSNIKAEMEKHVVKLKKQGLTEEALRLKERTEYDLEMIKQTGYCHGIENYSSHLDFRQPGEPPYTLIDFFKTKKDFLAIIDESHIAIPQLQGMFHGDHSRKTTLIRHGFRLPSALDNRPLKFEEFAKKLKQVIYVSATPKTFEIRKSGKNGVTEQLVRPTGLLDPTIEIVRTENQVKHLIEEIKKRTAQKQRALVTTLTKRMAEDLTEYLANENIKVNYIHSEIKTLQRLEIIRDLRLGNYDVIVGVNLLREGLDLPEVSLIAILDADKEGFLRNATTLIQTMGRAARNVHGHIIMYADKTTKSMKAAMDETIRRRKAQEKYNLKNKITPTTIIKEISVGDLPAFSKTPIKYAGYDLSKTSRFNSARQQLTNLQKEIDRAIKKLDFERAIMIREQIKELKKRA